MTGVYDPEGNIQDFIQEGNFNDEGEDEKSRKQSQIDRIEETV